MKRSSLCILDVILWSFVLYLATHAPSVDTRTNDDEMQKYVAEQPQVSTASPEPLTTSEEQKKRNNSCFHMPRSRCPTNGTACTRVNPESVFCCDVDSFRFKEALQIFRQNMSYLHVLNATLDKLNVSEAMYRRLVSMAFTDGNIGMVVGQFPKYSSIACLNISNNNLTSKKLDPSNERPFAHLTHLTYLDASANNLTEFPYSLVQSNRIITVDFSGNDHLACKHFQKAMDSKMVLFHNYEKTQCALDAYYNWFTDVSFVNIDYLHQQKELLKMCKFIRPENINCTCALERIELMSDKAAVNLISVDCSRRHLKEMPTNLPTNTVKLDVSHNNITSLQPMSDDPSYDDLKQLLVDYNDITSIVDLEGTNFIDNFMLFSITHNKLSAIHTYVLSNKFDMNSYMTLLIADNYIHCDCNTEKILKPWLIENSKNIPDYKLLQCQNNMGPVVDLFEYQVCHSNRDWTDYIYYIIALEVLVLVLLISKVSYDYWVFKTAGYLPWPANKMPRLPCDWLCE